MIHPVSMVLVLKTILAYVQKVMRDMTVMLQVCNCYLKLLRYNTFRKDVVDL